MALIDEIVKSWTDRSSQPKPLMPGGKTKDILEAPTGFDPTDIRNIQQQVLEPGSQTVVVKWDELLKSGTLTSAASIFETQREYIKSLRKQSYYKDKTDKEFKRDVEIPIIERSFEDPLVAPDYLKSMSWAGRVGMGSYSEGMELMGGLPQAAMPEEGTDLHPWVTKQAKVTGEVPMFGAKAEDIATR